MMKNDIHREKKSFILVIAAFFLFWSFATSNALASENDALQCSDKNMPDQLNKRTQNMVMDILEVAHSGDIKNLRYVLEQNELWPLAHMSKDKNAERDPIKSWVAQSPDETGHWLLAQLPLLFMNSFAERPLGPHTKLHIWPSFADKKISEFCPEEIDFAIQLNGKDLFEKMDKEKAYQGFQVAIADNGVWHYLMRKNVE